jgi:methionyl-tRNA formyltransferase
VGARVKVVFLTTDDPIYLPAFFDRVLNDRGDETEAVYLVPPLYKGQTPARAAWRYYRTFGFRAVTGLAIRIARAKLRRQSIEDVCKRHGVEYRTAEDVNSPEFLDGLRAIGPDIVVSVSCPQIFKKDLINVPSFGCLNIHGAVLPHYRGVLPSFWMLANGEKEAGVTIHFVVEKIDAGDVVGQKVFEILPDESLDAFIRRSKAIAAELFLDVLRKIEDGTLAPEPLVVAEGSYYSWPDRDAVKRFHEAGRTVW